MKSIKIITLTAIMAVLANILSIPPFAIPLVIGPFETAIHFSQLPIFLAGILAGPTAGLMTGVIGGFYMSFTRIPFIIGGLAILGYSAGLLARRFNPFVSGILAWIIQAPYVLLTDYVWFSIFLQTPQTIIWGILTPIMAKLTIEAVISAFLALVVIRSIKRLQLSF